MKASNRSGSEIDILVVIIVGIALGLLVAEGVMTVINHLPALRV